MSVQAHIRHKLSKEERLALVRAGREDRGKYQARTAIKQKKVWCQKQTILSMGLSLYFLMHIWIAFLRFKIYRKYGCNASKTKP